MTSMIKVKKSNPQYKGFEGTATIGREYVDGVKSSANASDNRTQRLADYKRKLSNEGDKKESHSSRFWNE